MKPGFLWSLIGLSALLHGVLFYFLSNHSFFYSAGASLKKSFETVSIELPSLTQSKIQPTPSLTPQETWNQTSLEKSLAELGQESLEKSLLTPKTLFSSVETMSKNNQGTKLFGIKNEGFRFVYLLDVSGSMREKVNSESTRLDYAKSEIQRSIEALPEVAEFNVLLFADRVEIFSPHCVSATDTSKAQALAFLKKESYLSGVTDIANGLGVALAQWPDVIFLMTDGVSNMSEEAFRSQWHYLYERSKSKAQISVIGFLLDQQQEDLLREICNFTQGKFWHWKG